MAEVRIAATGYGRRVALVVAPADLAAVRAVLPWWWHDDAPGTEPAAVFEVPDAARARDVVAALELDVAEHAEGFVFVHAGVVTWGDGALLLPGPSFAGKSTLTAALLDAGAGYLSDEYAVLDAAGRVHAYPRPLAIRSGADRNHRVVPSAPGPLQVTAVALLHYAADNPFAVEAVTPGEAVLGLLANTVCARSRPAEALRAVAAVADHAVTVVGGRGEASEAVRRLPEVLGSVPN